MVSSLWPKAARYLSLCVPQAKMVLHSSVDEEYLMICENYMRFKFSVSKTLLESSHTHFYATEASWNSPTENLEA
jgi:hypothetical protein